jgi:MFS family permease
LAHLTPSVPTTHPYSRRWRILGLLGVAQLMLILDVTVVAIALPDISSDLGLGRQLLTWVVSGYTLAFGGLLLLGGRAADLFGARRLVVVGLVLFAAASLLAGLAPTGWALLGGRVLQGVAAAILSPSALSLVVTIFDGAERDRALDIWSALGGAGAALGLFVATALMITTFFLGSFYLQNFRGYDALQTGLQFLPVALATMAGATTAGRVLGRFGPRLLGAAGLLIGGVGMSVAATVDGSAVMVAGVSLAAAGTGAVFVVASATALGQITPVEAGLASGIVSTFHEFGAATGTAVVSSIAAISLAGTSPAGFSRGFTTAAVVAAVTVLVTLAFAPGRQGSKGAPRPPCAFGRPLPPTARRSPVSGARDGLTAWLAVVAGNACARRFYTRMGWRDMGRFIYQAQTDHGMVAVPAHRYEREVGPCAR